MREKGREEEIQMASQVFSSPEANENFRCLTPYTLLLNVLRWIQVILSVNKIYVNSNQKEVYRLRGQRVARSEKV